MLHDQPIASSTRSHSRPLRGLCLCLLVAAYFATPVMGQPQVPQQFPHPRYSPHQRSHVQPHPPMHTRMTPEMWKEIVARRQQTALPLAVYVKVLGPEQTQVVFYDSQAREHTTPSPALAGMRARHRYAFALSQTPFAPQRRFHGTIEILRGPRLPEGVKGPEVPVPINFTEEDCAALARDQMLTKIIVLEDPELALAAPIGDDETLRYEATLAPDALETAKSLGALVMIVRIGDRVPEKEEIVGVTTAGTLVLPKPGSDTVFRSADDGDIVLTAHGAGAPAISHPPAASVPQACNLTGDGMGPACPPGAFGPGVNFPGWPYVDRFYGEYLCDGGDLGKKAGRDRFGVLVNVDPSDTIAEYRDNYDQHRIVESNRVCVYAPRYAEVRYVQMVEGFQVERIAELVARDRKLDTYAQLTPSVQARHEAQPQAVRMRQRASGFVREQWISGYAEVRVLEGVETEIGFGQTGSMTGPYLLLNEEMPFLAKRVEYAETMTREQFPKVYAHLQGLGELVMVWRHQEIVLIEQKPGLGRLKLEKAASKTEAKIGETVVFEIKYTNIGNETLSAVAVVDSLLSRLTYVEDSASSSRDAVFTAEENEVGSHTLRWEIQEPLEPGESGTVSFEAKVR